MPSHFDYLTVQAFGVGNTERWCTAIIKKLKSYRNQGFP